MFYCVYLGVIGLTTAITILEKLPHIQCYIVASCLPGDNKTIEYTSPWAASGSDILMESLT